jgi:protease II
MLSYSPYDNIKAQNYPNMLVTGGINDSQVLFHEPTKYFAKLRSLKTDDNILLLHMKHGVGPRWCYRTLRRDPGYRFRICFYSERVRH